MKKILLLITAALPCILFAQEKESAKEAERIIITKKGADDGKINIVVDGENITVNGKPLKEDEDGNITVKRMKIKDLDNFSAAPGYDWSPFRNFERAPLATNKAMLGVITEKDAAGAKIVTVNAESAAEKAGLKKGDVITEVDSKKITTPDELSQALKDKNPGDKVNISYTRDGKKATTSAALTKWNAPQAMTFNASPDFEFNDIFGGLQNELGNGGNRRWHIQTHPNFNISSGPKLGIKIQDVETGTGVKVMEVEKGSDADRAGLKEGDIIKEANNNTINSTDDMIAQTRKNRAGTSIKLKIERKGRAESIDVQLSKKIKTADL